MIRHVLIAATVAAVGAAAAPSPTAAIQRPRALTASGGACRVSADGAILGVNIGPNPAMPTLALTVGPSPMADAMRANKAKYTGPGTYTNEIVALYLGKTALDDSHIGLGTVVVNPDGKSGTFELNDHTGAGTFDCGARPHP